jgi:hypothetical protein
MLKTYTFGYQIQEAGDDDTVPYPANTVLTATHNFHDACTWDIILYQFCKFLEGSGYVGVTERVVLKDPLGIMNSNQLFESIGNEGFPYDEEDWGEDEEEESEEEDYLKKDDEYIDEISKLDKEDK